MEQENYEEFEDFQEPEYGIEVVIFKLGPTERVWTVNQTYLTLVSQHLRSLIIQAGTHAILGVPVVALPKESAKFMGIYLNSINEGSLLLPGTNLFSTDDVATRKLDLLSELYLLGMRLHDPKFMNAVLDGIINVSSTSIDDGYCMLPDPKHINLLYRNTVTGSCARRLMVDLHGKQDPEALNLGSDNDEEFLQDLRDFELRRDRHSDRDVVLTYCDYHEHKDGKKCR